MPKIELTTLIPAPVEVCFDLARNIDLHQDSMKASRETAITGVKNGLIHLHEEVTWKAKHFGFWFTMKVKITEFSSPDFFCDEMVKGPFKKMRHEHYFHQTENEQTAMKDIFYFESPVGVLGKLVDYFFLKKYMAGLLKRRNQFLKEQSLSYVPN